MTRKEGSVLFNDALNTFYFMVIWHWIYGKASEKKSATSTMGYSFQLAARDLLHAPSHRQDSTYHSLCYTSCGTLAGMRNSLMKDRSDDPSHHEWTLYHNATSHSLFYCGTLKSIIYINVNV